MKDKYREIMDRVSVTDAMRRTVLRGVHDAAGGEQQGHHKQRAARPSRAWTRGLAAALCACAGAAACLLVLPSMLRHDSASPTRTLVSGASATREPAGGYEAGLQQPLAPSPSVEVPSVTASGDVEEATVGAGESSAATARPELQVGASANPEAVTAANPSLHIPVASTSAEQNTVTVADPLPSGDALPPSKPDTGSEGRPVSAGGALPQGTPEAGTEPSAAIVTLEAPGTASTSTSVSAPPTTSADVLRPTPDPGMPAAASVGSGEPPGDVCSPTTGADVTASPSPAVPSPSAEPTEPAAAPSPIPTEAPEEGTASASTDAADSQ